MCSPRLTWDESPLDERHPVAGAGQLELHAAEGGALAVELRRDGALAPGTRGQLEPRPG